MKQNQLDLPPDQTKQMNEERFDECVTAIRLFTEGSTRAAKERCRHHFSHKEVVHVIEWLAYFPNPEQRHNVASFLTGEP